MYVDFSLKFDCEKLAQEKIEVHRQYVMVNWKIQAQKKYLKTIIF